MNDIRGVGVVGAGQMGLGIAEVSARAGLEVLIYDAHPAAARTAMNRVAQSLTRAASRGKLRSDEADRAISLIQVVTDLDAFSSRDVVIEAVAEDAAAKLAVFSRLDAAVDNPDAVLATNTSSIPITKIAASVKRPGQVIGLHFFNPVPVLPLVELVPSLLTSRQTTARARAFAETTLNKTVITSQDRAGFVVNTLLVPYVLAAIRMLESGYASAQDIDHGMELGCAHPMGPLRLADLIGLDIVKAIAEAMYDEFKEPLHSPPPLLSRMVEAGLTGRKAGRGFHDYRT
ncbi:3-hydroxybutyryl-CoA dehydrogenase [Streptomyces solaniscabiei]|uniref:3-hydroxybutyryl-CoA dehydrogenase n=1 Tax=Streptomyces solaniscabiei TaxID=2683255 RepID=UPI001CE28469